MNQKICHLLLIILLIVHSKNSLAQPSTYKYWQPLATTHEKWQLLTLPDGVYQHCRPDFADIRLYGVDEHEDTIEAPYISVLYQNYNQEATADARLLNPVQQSGRYYFTLEMPGQTAIRELNLQFDNSNFDWHVRLEGSHDQTSWFKIMDNYRLLSIQNDLTDYRFTKLLFPTSNYRYYRISIPTAIKPVLTRACFPKAARVDIPYQKYKAVSTKVATKMDTKQTIITVFLKQPVYVSTVHLDLDAPFDFYRPVDVSYLPYRTDLPEGYTPVDEPMLAGIVQSAANNDFTSEAVLTNRLTISINNKDNPPLNVKDVVLSGPRFDLKIRIDQPGRYWLVYGKKDATAPEYDLENLRDRIPQQITAIRVQGTAISRDTSMPPAQTLQLKQYWLWIAIVSVILVLGWFTLRMMSQR